MQYIEPPPPPFDISALPKRDQAQAALTLYSEAADTAGQCLKSRDTLISWILGE